MPYRPLAASERDHKVKSCVHPFTTRLEYVQRCFKDACTPLLFWFQPSISIDKTELKLPVVRRLCRHMQCSKRVKGSANEVLVTFS